MDIKVGRNWGLFAAGIALVIIGFVLLSDTWCIPPF